MQQIDLMSTKRKLGNKWIQKSTRSGEHHDECIQQVWYTSPGLFEWKCVDTMKVWWVDIQMDEHPNEWVDKPIPMTMAYMTSSTFVITRTNYGSLPITIKLLLREVLVCSWDKYDDILCEITQLHVIKMWPEQKGVIFLTSSNAFFLKFVHQIPLNYDPDCLINDKSALVQPIW